MRIYFTRHGESEANLLHIFSNRDLKHALTPRGIEQVQRLADRLEDIRFDAFYTSPVYRAVQSADILSQRLNVAYSIEPALIEYHVGIWDGKDDKAGWQEYDRVLHEWLHNRNWDERMEGGESFNDIRARFVPFIESLLSAYSGSDAVILCLGHGGTYRTMLPLVLANVDFGYTAVHSIGYSSYILAEQRGEHLVCLSWDGEQLSPDSADPHSA